MDFQSGLRPAGPSKAQHARHGPGSVIVEKEFGDGTQGRSTRRRAVLRTLYKPLVLCSLSASEQPWLWEGLCWPCPLLREPRSPSPSLASPGSSAPFFGHQQ